MGDDLIARKKIDSGEAVPVGKDFCRFADADRGLMETI